MSKDLLLVGLDGGATKISGWTAEYDAGISAFSLGATNIQRSYRDYPDFNPNFQSTDIKIQLAEFGAGTIRPIQSELSHSQAYTQACIDVVTAIAEKHHGKPLLLGLGMPGLKTTDQRGIAVLLNGPRIPAYADTVETALADRDIELAAPIFRIGSDADYCGIGEEYSADGSFSGITNAYYLGGGTGTADALKLAGKLVPLDLTKSWLAKTWEMKNDKAISLERYSSAGGIQSIYSTYSGIPVEQLNVDQVYPNQILRRARDGEAAATAAYEDISTYLSQLLFERISTIYGGWKNNFAFVNPNRAELESEHSYRGTLLDRIIIGQRLGILLDDSKTSGLFYQPLVEKLGQLVAESNLPESFKKYYLMDGKFKTALLTSSKLREAPALGAAIDAYLNLKK